MPYEFKLPDIGEGLREAEIVKWLVKKGERIEEDQPVAEVQTDKATVEISSPVKGTVLSMAGEEGNSVVVGETLVTLEQHDSHLSLNEDLQKKSRKRVIAAPTVRKKARELGIDITKVTGSEKDGRIVLQDLYQYLNEKKNKSSSSTLDNTQTAHQISKIEERIPVRGIRKKIAEKMVQSYYTAPHVTGMSEVDVTKLVEAKKAIQANLGPDDPKVTYLPFIIKAVIKALKEIPIFNSSLDNETNEIVLKKRYNIGIAVATKEGLVVPVIKNADHKTIFELAKDISQLTEKARTQKLSLDDVRDGTFTISSTGSNGGWFATPIINYPEVAILGVHAIQKRPVVTDNDQIVARQMMGMSLTFDHRVIDGEPSGRFMNFVKNVLEKPEMLLLDVR
ncbi:dihydrolipoamide acetyltransferase family protein [Scopulibacillus cellulosilyticus]|uniref:Dihydrolipoamide acetyltransferase component of pyruvate dehydrogenase complex n=1 Tax=Scopulibacillus cellulosilyticus TaxID=2665665 RepID=A0ABW2PWA0_9BACL